MKGLETAPHKYKEIYDHILDRIENGDLIPGMRLPGVRVLGKKYGCNYHTVRHAFEILADQGYVELRQGSGTFVTERAMGHRKRKVEADKVLRETDRIGVLLILRQRWGHYVTSLIDQLHRTAEEKGLSLDTRTVSGIDISSTALVHELMNQDCCSIILPWVGEGQSLGALHDFVRASELPVVLPFPVHGLERNCYYQSLPSDLDTYYSGTYLQCHYFQKLGFGNIALLGPASGGSKYFEHKLLQYSRWADRENMPNLIGLVDGSKKDFDRIVARWSSMKGDLAVVAYHDEMALDFISACKRNNIRVPEDIAILGHNNNPIGIRSTPTLSTMLCPYDHIAEGMIKHALALSNGLSAQLGGRERKAFFIRESCGGRQRLGDRVDTLVEELLKEFYATNGVEKYLGDSSPEKSYALEHRR